MKDHDNRYPPIHIFTRSRDELVRVSMLIAACIPPEAFHRENGVPIIQLYGDGTTGKSMVIEAIMKTILNEYDPNEMNLPTSKREMFIEKEPCYSFKHYCMASGTLKGRKLFLGFERFLYEREKILHGFEKAAKKESILSLAQGIYKTLRGKANLNFADMFQTAVMGSKANGAIFKCRAMSASYEWLDSTTPVRKDRTYPHYLSSIGVDGTSVNLPDMPWFRAVTVSIDKADSPHAQEFYENFKRLMTPYLEAQAAPAKDVTKTAQHKPKMG